MKMEPKWWEKLTSSTKNDAAIKRQIQEGKIAKSQRITLYENRIWISNDAELRTTILSECHDSAIARHIGVEKTLEAVQRI